MEDPSVFSSSFSERWHFLLGMTYLSLSLFFLFLGPFAVSVEDPSLFSSTLASERGNLISEATSLSRFFLFPGPFVVLVKDPMAFSSLSLERWHLFLGREYLSLSRFFFSQGFSLFE